MDEPNDGFLPASEPESELPAWPGEPVEPEARDIAAMAALDAGRFIGNEAMMRWLQSIVDGKPIAPPEVGD